MNDKEAITILTDLLKRDVLSAEEQEAVRLAIGVLSWTKLSESRIQNLKAKKERERGGGI